MLPVRSAALCALVIGPCLALAQAQGRQPATPYFPPPHQWERRMAAAVGFDAALLDEAVTFATSSETPRFKDLLLDQATTFGAREPFDTPIGPMKERGPVSGLIIRNGYLVAQWGDPDRVDMTHSVTKTFLSTVASLAFQRGLIKDVNDRARPYMPPGVDLFDAPHNQSITWDHLLRQTSDWQGTMWGKPDWADRPEGEPSQWPNRKLYEPGTRYKYNDARVNAFALALLHVFRRPLPDVLRDEIMEPIGASSTWQWHGYENSWVTVNGQRVQSVSGGGHWGGGMFINAWDMARFGYLFLRNGRWKDRQLVAEQWITQARTPGKANDQYGYMNWYLNTGRTSMPATPESSVRFVGNGPNNVYIDWENDLVVVVRWIRDDRLNEFYGKVLAALRVKPTA
ncbi:MAG: serine hydrolase [Acidobacteria bacterium RIFCSPLOWO2_02_FULL_68_18]|nr:MAG: serine hydrolase [Acidobacteria bacterium RIFCSPLOWO2_02_FULL_68_18]OFW47973.1 MAG: serine hydrolase [Acidobacteria bacterium RIFCSPLOWO2_12_FULL_68_19]